MYRLLCCCFLALLCAWQAQAAPPPLVFSSKMQESDLKPHAEYLRDASGEMTLDEVRQLVRDNPQSLQTFSGIGNAFHLGYTRDAVWVRTTVVNELDESQSIVFDVDYPFVNRVAMYQIKDGQLLAQDMGGDGLSLDTRHYRSRGIALPAELAPDSRYEFFFRIRTPGLFSLPVKVYSAPAFFEHLQISDAVLYGIFGLYMGFFLYHLLVFFDNRQWAYLAFATSALTRLAYDLYASGAGQFLTPDAIRWNNLSFIYIGAYAAAAGLWFHLEFLSLRKNSRKTYRWILAYAATFLISAQYAYFVDYYFFVAMGVLHLALPIVLFVSALPSAMGGYRPAKIYLLGCVVMLMTLLGSNLNLVGILPTVPNQAIWGALGFTLAFMIFSFGLSAKNRELAEQKRRATYEAETARARARAKSEFLAHMSHEIRTPLNGVLGMIQLLSTSKLDAQQKSWVKVINSSGSTLMNIVNDILDYSKIEAGKLSIEKVPFDPRSICTDLVSLFSHTGNSDVEMTLDIDPALPRLVEGDPARLRQVLTNLVSNAHKFTARGKVTIAVEKLSGPDRYRLSVIDTGIGISPQQQERLFSSFEQIRSDIHRHYGGTGLGLAICKRLTELMGGTIGVSSEVGVGSTFWLELPLPEASRLEESLASPEPGAASPALAGASLCVLVAEDNKVNQFVIENLLQRLGHRCKVVGDGCEAIKEIQQDHNRYDVVLMDCDMPKKNGYDATLEIREFELSRKLPRKPIIALSAHAMEIIREKCIRHGMDDHLAKPLVMETLQAILRKHCSLALAS